MTPKIGLALLAPAILASCVTTGDSQQSAQRVLDGICAAEPAVYAAFSAVAEVKKVPATTVRRVDTAHVAITNWCTDRPDNLVAVLVTVTSTYAQILVANERYGK
jgi:hypothetical protein